MTAYVFPGQGSQFPGMGKDLYDADANARIWFEHANDILGFKLTDVMFTGTEADLKQTRVTQPAIFLHSVVKAKVLGDAFQPNMVAGHSLGGAMAGDRRPERPGGVGEHAQRSRDAAVVGQFQARVLHGPLGIDEDVERLPHAVTHAREVTDAGAMADDDRVDQQRCCGRMDLPENGCRNLPGPTLHCLKEDPRAGDSVDVDLTGTRLRCHYL